MNVTRIANQDNRTNFNGVLFIKGRFDCTPVKSAFDYEIAKKISQITDEMVSQVTHRDGKKSIVLKDGSVVDLKISTSKYGNGVSLGYNTPDNAFFPFRWLESIGPFDKKATYDSFEPAVNRVKEIV